ncbi:Uncharacterised protein [Mycobacteroides abscessus subsp. abscessus]|nr:Uncharacterised protein [Mycobacteroides abscessus subsp. abscessus]
MIPSSRLPSLKAASAAATPRSAADSAPRPLSALPYTTSTTCWSGETAISTASSGVGTLRKTSRAPALVSLPRSPMYTEKRAFDCRDP